VTPANDPALAAFGSSLSAITLAELGDKTFFMALILATRHRRSWVFVGAFAALAAVTVLSLALGYGAKELMPAASVPWIAAVLFGGFGLKLLLDAHGMGSDAAEEEAEQAEATVNAAEAGQRFTSAWSVIWEAFVLVFIAELGDRTQFATVFLATAPGFGFAALLAGALVGHGLVTALAVNAGQWMGQRVNERLLYRLSGGLFLVFGLLALKQALG
jgi:putative Ca2+/H+ antiporter (TMEM165/GDT1 family)